MRVKIIYQLPGQGGQELTDLLTWPDVSDEAELHVHVATYLDQKYGAGGSILVRIEVL